MRRASLLVASIAITLTAACSGSSAAPSKVGGVTDISGSWSGNFNSTNIPNLPTVPISVSITQNGSRISGNWTSDVVLWSGTVTATMDGSSISGQLTFSGTTVSQTVCIGTANFTGSATTTTLTLTSPTGVVGPACPAPLPAGIQIDLHR